MPEMLFPIILIYLSERGVKQGVKQVIHSAKRYGVRIMPYMRRQEVLIIFSLLFVFHSVKDTMLDSAR